MLSLRSDPFYILVRSLRPTFNKASGSKAVLYPILLSTVESVAVESVEESSVEVGGGFYTDGGMSIGLALFATESALDCSPF